MNRDYYEIYGALYEDYMRTLQEEAEWADYEADLASGDPWAE